MNADFQSIQQQHDYVDNNIRSTNNIDYDVIKKDCLSILEKRKHGEHISDVSFPLLIKKCPKLYETLKTCPKRSIDEFTEILDLMIKKLIDVQSGKDTMSNVRNDIFEVNLANKYLKKT